MAATVPLGVPFLHGGFLAWNNEIAKTGNYTILLRDNGTLFTNAGATGSVTFTLPAIGANLRFGFFAVAGQNLEVASNEGSNIVTFNNAAASNLTFSTAGQLIGGGLILQSNLAATLWFSFNMSSGANTISVA